MIELDHPGTTGKAVGVRALIRQRGGMVPSVWLLPTGADHAVQVVSNNSDASDAMGLFSP